MFDIPLDIVPKAAVPAVLGTAAFAYLVAGPEIAARVAQVDHLPGCEREIAASIAAGAATRREATERPALDPAKEAAAAYLRQLQSSPLFGEMRKHPLGGLMGLDLMAGTVEAYERGKVQAERAAAATRQKVDALTATQLARTGSVCGCMADRAIADTRTDWAIFTGTLGLVRPARIAEFGATMRRSDPDGICLKELRP